jgi:hypothetical protein
MVLDFFFLLRSKYEEKSVSNRAPFTVIIGYLGCFNVKINSSSGVT